MTEKEIAQKLRAQGKTFGDIQEIIGRKIPKGTLSYWLKDVKLPPAYLKTYKENMLKSLARGRVNSLAYSRKKQEDRMAAIRKNCDEFLRVPDPQIYKIALSFLYLGEGYKWKSHRGLQLGSSSEELMELYVLLLEKCYNVKRMDLHAFINHRADQNLLGLKRYWSKVLEIPLKNFYQSKADPRTIGKKTIKMNYHGVCVVSCAGTDKQLELETLPKVLLKNLGP
jgi:hypothetical protein